MIVNKRWLIIVDFKPKVGKLPKPFKQLIVNKRMINFVMLSTLEKVLGLRAKMRAQFAKDFGDDLPLYRFVVADCQEGVLIVRPGFDKATFARGDIAKLLFQKGKIKYVSKPDEKSKPPKMAKIRIVQKTTDVYQAIPTKKVPKIEMVVPPSTGEMDFVNDAMLNAKAIVRNNYRNQQAESTSPSGKVLLGINELHRQLAALDTQAMAYFKTKTATSIMEMTGLVLEFYKKNLTEPYKGCATV